MGRVSGINTIKNQLIPTGEITADKLATLGADPNADRVLFWDDSASALKYLTIGNNLAITGTQLDATAGTGAEILTATATWTSSYSSGTTSAEDLTNATITLSGLTSGSTYTIFAIASFSGDNNSDNNRLNSFMNMGGSNVNGVSHLQSGAGRDVPTTIHGLVTGVTGVTTYTAKIQVSSDGGTKRVNPAGHTQRISIIALQEV